MVEGDELGSWDYTEKGAYIGLIIESPSGEAHAENEELVRVDTGFSGHLLLPRALYNELNLNMHEIGPTLCTVADGREIPADQALGQIKIPQLGNTTNIIILCFREGYDRDEPLLGLKFLKKFSILLDGIESKICILKCQN